MDVEASDPLQVNTLLHIERAAWKLAFIFDIGDDLPPARTFESRQRISWIPNIFHDCSTQWYIALSTECTVEYLVAESQFHCFSCHGARYGCKSKELGPFDFSKYALAYRFDSFFKVTIPSLLFWSNAKQWNYHYICQTSDEAFAILYRFDESQCDGKLACPFWV